MAVFNAVACPINVSVDIGDISATLAVCHRHRDSREYRCRSLTIPQDTIGMIESHILFETCTSIIQ